MQTHSLTWLGRHRKWPFLGGKPPLFWFFKITGKVVENHPFWWIFQKTRKSGGFPPLFVIFTQNLFIFYQIKFFFGRETTIFSGFFKNPSKRVVFHQFHGFFQKPEKWWFSTIFYGFSKKPPKWVGFHHFWLVKTAHSVQIMLNGPDLGGFCPFSRTQGWVWVISNEVNWWFFGFNKTKLLKTTIKGLKTLKKYRKCHVFIRKPFSVPFS